MAGLNQSHQYDWSDVSATHPTSKGVSNPEVELHEVSFAQRTDTRSVNRGMYNVADEDEFDAEQGLSSDGMNKHHYVMSTKNKAGAAMANRYSVREHKLGTIKGVFLPCFQNILGVILFIRLPYITGQAGVLLTLLIIFLSKLATSLTTLSMSAIATNGTVQAGGPYFIISRNLGVELGGAIGTLFYLGTTIASSLYVLGAVEVIRASFDGQNTASYVQQLLSLMIMSLITLTVSVGVKYVNMSAALFLGLVLFSLGSIVLGIVLFASGSYTGHLSSEDRLPFDNLYPRYTTDPATGVTPTFYSLLALFFPSATGIMAGCNRSSVLLNPGRSIPKGTLSAIGATAFTYVFFVFLFGCTLQNSVLIEDKLVAMRVAWPTPYLVAIGIVAACLGAAMQCITGASKLLAAISNDQTIPFLSYFSPKADSEPIRAVFLTGIIATLPCMSGNLDYITAPVTMAFLLMYASINLSCFVLCVLKSPGFRPQWKYFSWMTSLGGVCMCVTLMLIVSWQAAVVLIVLAFALLFYIKYQNATRDWGDTLTGFRYQVARDMLLSLSDKQTMHAKNWRPQILVLCSIDEGGNPQVPELLSLASQMKKGRGLLMTTALMKGDHVQDALKAAEAQKVLLLHLTDEKIEGFCKVSVCHDPVDAAITIMHHSGMGTMQPNSVLIAWPDDWSKNSANGTAFVATLRGAVHARKSFMVLKGGQALPTQFERLPPNNTVDIWWVAHDGGLLLLVPYLLSLHPVWARCQLRLFSVIVDPNDNPQQVETDVREYLDQVRILAEVTVVDMSDVNQNKAVYEMEIAARKAQMQTTSKQVSFVLESAKNSSEPFTGPLMGGASTAAAYGARGGLGEIEELEGDINAQNGLRWRLSRLSGTALGASNPDSPTNPNENWTAEDVGEKGDPEGVRYRRKMTAVLLNRHMHVHSSKARLVVTNFPLVKDMAPYDVLNYVENITEGLAPVLMIRGTGQEVITQFG